MASLKIKSPNFASHLLCIYENVKTKSVIDGVTMATKAVFTLCEDREGPWNYTRKDMHKRYPVFI